MTPIVEARIVDGDTGRVLENYKQFPMIDRLNYMVSPDTIDFYTKQWYVTIEFRHLVWKCADRMENITTERVVDGKENE
jgi:hypothetical protein